MSRPLEANNENRKTSNYVVNFTLKTHKGYSLNNIVDSLKGIENIGIDSKEIGYFTYDFIINFQTKNRRVFIEKWRELSDVLKEDFKRTYIIKKITFS